MKRIILYLNSILGVLLIAGCMGYQLGGRTPDGIKTVAIKAIINQTGEPAIELQITEALLQRIQFDGRLALQSSPRNADAVITVILTNYKLTGIAFRDHDRSTPEAYRLRIDAEADLTSTATGEKIGHSRTYGETVFDFNADLTTSKRSALPRAAEELAKFMLDDLIESW